MAGRVPRRLLSRHRLGQVARARRLRIALIVMFLVPPGTAAAQDLEPGTYVNAPVGANALVLGVGRTRGEVVFDPTLPVEDAQARINAITVGYVRAPSTSPTDRRGSSSSRRTRGVRRKASSLASSPESPEPGLRIREFVSPTTCTARRPWRPASLGPTDRTRSLESVCRWSCPSANTTTRSASTSDRTDGPSDRRSASRKPGGPGG